MLAAAALPALLGGCAKAYSKDGQSVTIKVDPAKAGGAEKVRLQVLGPKIIRVSATPTADFAADASLVVLEQEKYSDFTVKQENDSTIRVATPEISATVSTLTGAVTFYDKDGKLILAENGGGRSFTPINVEGTDSYTVQQTFASTDDEEGLYGLGQHQSNEFNYKGLNEELFQYNTKVSVPFVVSTGNYGVLWDSYSLLRFGGPETSDSAQAKW